MRNFVAPLIFFLMVDIKNRFSTFERYTYERLSKIFWKKYVHTNGTQKIKYVHTSGTKTAMWQKNIFGCRNFCRKKFFKDILMNFIYIPKIVSEAIFDIYCQKKWQGGGQLFYFFIHDFFFYFQVFFSLKNKFFLIY